jgi:hypothetical protein
MGTDKYFMDSGVTSEFTRLVRASWRKPLPIRVNP